jgi:hypothetical protein
MLFVGRQQRQSIIDGLAALNAGRKIVCLTVLPDCLTCISGYPEVKAFSTA